MTTVVATIEVPDTATVDEARKVMERFHEEFDDVHVTSTMLIDKDGDLLLDLMEK